jgi:RNA recognition motif-containing protein
LTDSSVILLFLFFSFQFFSMNIFVAKLNFSTRSEGLREVFEQFGEVESANVIMDRDSGRSKGFGFVEMPNDGEAQSAITGLDGTDLDGSTIVVKKAEPRENRSGGGGGGFKKFDNRGGGGDRRSFERPRRDDRWSR